MQAISKEAALVAIHDSARPLISAEDTRACIQDANQVSILDIKPQALLFFSNAILIQLQISVLSGWDPTSYSLPLESNLFLQSHLLGIQVGAAVLGVPVKPTIKEIRPDGTVVKTLKRANLWEVQTPQVLFTSAQESHSSASSEPTLVSALYLATFRPGQE